ncbi:MAG: hypothetical protein P8L77_02010 [Gammaproteobacteria bacterium]|nr:hypothetical protein [Gammaproteobacteria bacterium]
MKNLYLITLLSLFMVNASYAQDCGGGEDTNEACEGEGSSQSSTSYLDPSTW